MNENIPIISTVREKLQTALDETLDNVAYIEEAIQKLAEQEQILQDRYDHHISLKNECIEHDYDDPENRDTDTLIHSENASAVYQIAASLGFKLKTEGE